MKVRLHMNKFILLSTMAFLSLSPALMAQESNLDERIKVAQGYTEIFPVKNDIETAIGNMILQVPAADRPLLQSILQRNVNADSLKTASELALAETFTLDELKALMAFYKTDAGKAVKEKMPQFQQKIQPILEAMVRKSLEEFQKQK